MSALLIRVRVGVAVALMIGFHLLGVAVVLVLAVPPVLDLADGADVTWIRVARLALAAFVLWRILPRRARFEAPGELVDATSQPELAAVVEEVAHVLGTRPAEEIYLTEDFSAAIGDRGRGVAGRRRMLVLGLPALDVLDRDGLRALLAHEYAHYTGGDLAAGRWVWRTQEAIVRTLEDTSPGRTTITDVMRIVTGLPFLLYGLLFRRVTRAISRAEELRADALGARLTSPAAYGSMLVAMSEGRIAYAAYLAGDFAQAITAGVRPPLLEGFRLYRAEPRAAEALAVAYAADRAARTTAHDTHPSLADRLAALGDPPTAPAGEPRAVALLHGPDALEAVLVPRTLDVEPLRAVAWTEVGEAVIGRMAQDWQGLYGRPLAVAVGDLGPAVRDPDTGVPGLVEHLFGEAREQDAVREAIAGGVLNPAFSAALVLALHREGWTVHALPGRGFTLTLGAEEIAADAVVAALHDGGLSDEDWRARTEALGLADVPLGETAAPAPMT